MWPHSGRMFVPFSVIAGFAAGCGVAWVARGALRHARDRLRGAYAKVALWFGLLVWMPATLGVYLLAPDWSLMYLANPIHLPAALMFPLIALSSAGAPALGFLAAQRIDASAHGRQLYATVGGALLLLLGFGMRRIATGGTYEDVHYGTGGVWLSQLAVFWPVLIITLVALAALALTLAQVRQRVRAETEL